MYRTAKLIRAYEGEFPECTYYLPLLSKARRNARKHPDICIETCKTLLEGISKTIIFKLDSTAVKKDIDKKDADQIVKAAAKLLKQNDDVIEDNFVTRATSLTNALAALRNSRGDISHGKEVPKPEYSSENFARLCLQMTDALAVYLLEAYFDNVTAAKLDHAKVAVLPEVDSASYTPNINYEDNLEYNEDLDSNNPLPGKLLYSESLYELYYEDYILGLDEFIDVKDDL